MDQISLQNEFRKKGFVLLKGFFDQDKLGKITKLSEEIAEKAASAKDPWPYIRVYREYPEFFNKKNIFGVDFPFNQKLNGSIFDEIQKLDFKKKLLTNILGWKNFCTKFVRLHTNSSFYNYQGEWHRDAVEYPTPNAIQLILYMYDEEGFRIVPKDKNDSLEKYGFPKRGDKLGFSKLPKNLFEIINAKRGDVLIFESCLLHQGFCKKKRLHYHFRHERDDNLEVSNDRDILNFAKEYKKDFNLENSNIKIPYNEVSTINKYKVFILYFLPRLRSLFNNLKKNPKQSIFHSTIWQ